LVSEFRMVIGDLLMIHHESPDKSPVAHRQSPSIHYSLIANRQ
jgi:hypothetical protein